MIKAISISSISLFLTLFAPQTLWANADNDLHDHKDEKIKTLYVSTGFTPPISDFYGAVVAEVDKKLPDIQIKFEELSAERSIDLVNRGVNDAECCRIPKVVNKNYKNLVQVTESFYEARFTAFSKRDDLNIKSFDDLKPYSTATVLGWKILVNNVNRVNPKEKYIVSTPSQMMQMLKKDRVEVALLGYESGLKAIAEQEVEGVHTYLNPPLASVPLYLMLHKHNKDLIEPLSAAIKSLKNDGTVDKLYNQAFFGADKK